MVAYKFEPRKAFLRVELADGGARMPQQFQVIQLTYAVVGQGAAVTPADYNRFKESAALKFHLDFAESERQMVCYAHGVMTTKRGLKSPMSDTINFIVL